MEILDTTFLIDLAAGVEETKKIASKKDLFTTQINMYEYICGLFLAKPSKEKYEEIIEILGDVLVLQYDDYAVIRSADIYAELHKIGKKANENDYHIAGIALANGANKIVTRNKKHFENIKGIEVVKY